MSNVTTDSALAEGIAALLRSHSSGPGQVGDVSALLKEASMSGWLDVLQLGISASSDVDLEDALLVCEMFGRHVVPFSLAVATGFLKPLLAAVGPGRFAHRVESWLEEGALVAIPRPTVIVDPDVSERARFWLSSDLCVEHADGVRRLHGSVDQLTDGAARGVVVAVDEMLLAVPTNARGVTLTPIPAVVPGFAAGRVDFDGVVLDEAFATGSSIAAAVHHAAMAWSLALDAFAVGTCRELVATTVQFLLAREQFGKPIGAFQAVQHLTADMHIAAETSHSSLLAAARCVAEESQGSLETVAASRLYAGAAAVSTSQAAIQLHGGIGFTWEMGIHYWYRAAQFAQRYLTEEAELREFLTGHLGGSAVDAGEVSGE